MKSKLNVQYVQKKINNKLVITTTHTTDWNLIIHMLNPINWNLYLKIGTLCAYYIFTIWVITTYIKRDCDNTLGTTISLIMLIEPLIQCALIVTIIEIYHNIFIYSSHFNNIHICDQPAIHFNNYYYLYHSHNPMCQSKDLFEQIIMLVYVTLPTCAFILCTQLYIFGYYLKWNINIINIIFIIVFPIGYLPLFWIFLQSYVRYLYYSHCTKNITNYEIHPNYIVC